MGNEGTCCPIGDLVESANRCCCGFLGGEPVFLDEYTYSDARAEAEAAGKKGLGGFWAGLWGSGKSRFRGLEGRTNVRLGPFRVTGAVPDSSLKQFLGERSTEELPHRINPHAISCCECFIASYVRRACAHTLAARCFVSEHFCRY